jgi:hypothetical protein
MLKISTAIAGLTATAALAVPTPPAAAETWGTCSGYTKWTGTWGGEYTAWYPTDGQGTYNLKCTIRWRTPNHVRGAGVKVLQQALNLCYSAGLKVDGIYGPATAIAVADARNAEGYDGRYYDYGRYIQESLRWPNWHETSRREWHHHCIDNDLADR